MSTQPVWNVPPKSDRARLLGLIKRKAGISKEEFREYFYKQHVPTMLAILPEPGYLKLHLMEINDEINAQLASFGAKTMSEFDGVLMIEAESWEGLFKVWNDAEFAGVRKADEEVFADTAATLVIPVVSIPFLDN